MATQLPLQAVEATLHSITASAVPLLTETSAHILRAGGKRLRPRLVLLAHLAAGGTNLDYVVPLAAAVEVIHTATLVHDDINDRGTLRRGRETVNARWGGTFALLTGDFLFTKTYEIMVPYPPAYNQALARAAIRLVEGETLQIQAARAGELDRDTYYEIIARKTAALFVACAELGAMAAGAPAEMQQLLSDYAFNLGLAFQITDDILDLVGDTAQIGKDAGIDLSQGRGLAAALIRRDGDGQSATGTLPDTAPGPLAEIVVEDTLGLAVQQGRDTARELVDRAQAALDLLPPSEAVEDLRRLAWQVLERDR